MEEYSYFDEDPKKGWGSPIKLAFNGIDPSIFFDDNGKGYVVAKDRELVCNECQGRGEYLFVDGGRPQKQGLQETPETR